MAEKEADALMKSGKKHTEKTAFKWKADHDSAAADYEKAAKIYLQLKLKDKCTDAFTKAAHEHQKAKSAFFAGKCLETLALYLSEDAQQQYEQASSAGNGAAAVAAYFDNIKKAAGYYEQAAGIYFDDNKLSNQSDAMNKASQLFTEFIKTESRKLPQQRNDAVLQLAQAEYRRYASESLKSLELNWEANEASPHKLPDIYKNFVLAAIRSNDFFSAIQAEKRMLGIVEKGAPSSGFAVDNEVYDESKNLFKRLNQPHNAAKIGLEVIVLILAFNSDYIWANKEMEKLTRIDGFKASPEENCARQIIQCYEDRDEDQLADTIKSSGNVLNFLLSEVSRLAKKLKIAPSSATAPAAGTVVSKTVDGPAKAHEQQQEEEANGAKQAEEEEAIDPEEDLR